jgi:tetratricopeptide (TPR) repeat protein
MVQNRRKRVFVWAAMVLAAGLGACQEQRALHVVEDSGERAMWRGDYQTAAAEYGEVVDRRPGRWRARLELGKALLALDRPAEAREHLEVVYTIRPQDDEVLELLVTAMLESGDADAMAAELRQRAQDTGAVADWMRLGIFLQRAGDLDGAERALLTAARLDGGVSARPQMALAGLYREAGDDEDAIERLRMAHYVDPDNERILEAIRSYGEIPGPTFARRPAEASPGAR